LKAPFHDSRKARGEREHARDRARESEEARDIKQIDHQNLTAYIAYMSNDPKTQRFFMRIEPDLIERLDNWRASKRPVPSRSEAARQLLRRALDEAEDYAPALQPELA
jgi:hypothetical protein